MLAGCSKDEILNHYNNIVQSAGSIELTGKSSLQGEKEKGIDDYTGTYLHLLLSQKNKQPHTVVHDCYVKSSERIFAT